MFYWDPTYILVVIGAIISGIASANVNSTFNSYRRVLNRNGLTARQVAQEILYGAGIYDVSIERISGSLTDHYDPSSKVLRLSDTVYNSQSVAAIGVAAHECGHAIQHMIGYQPLKLRSASVPVANIGSWLSWPVIIIGIILGQPGLARAGVILFTFVVIFQLITLPVEFDASQRAINILRDTGMLEGEELRGATKVLKAAALTYVAALFATILQLLRLVMIVNRNNNRGR